MQWRFESLERVPAEHLESILVDTVKRLLRNRRLASWRVQHHYLVAVDGMLKWSAAYPWAREAVTKQTKTGDTVYQAYVVEAVLVCPQGIAIPLMAEFCEHTVDAAPETKQDSELKEFYRLARRPKTAFHPLKLTILADGLYPNGPLFRFLRDQRWDFMIVLKARQPQGLSGRREEGAGADAEARLPHRLGQPYATVLVGQRPGIRMERPGHGAALSHGAALCGV